MDSHVERALLRTGAVEACAVCLRMAGGRERRVAYVVPRGAFSPDDLRRQLVAAGDETRIPEAFVEVRRIPVTPDGRVDEAALLDLDVIDQSLADRWERALTADAGIADAAVLVEERPVSSRVLHLSDLVAGWEGTGDDALTSAGRDDQLAEEMAARRPLAIADGGPLEIPADAPRTLVDGLLRTALVHGRRQIRFVQTDGGEVRLSYADLLLAARRTLAGLRRIGLKAGDIAILQLPDLDEHFPTFWACLLGGIKPVTVAVPTSYDGKNAVVRKLFNTWQLLGRPPILAARRLVESIRGLERDLDIVGMTVVAADEVRHDPPAADHHPSRPEDVAFFQLSSGSTGISKCIQITHRGVVNHIHGSQQHLGLSSEDVTLNWLPMDHVVPLLMYHTKDTYLGVEAVQVPGPVVLADPLKWLDYMEQYRATHSWAPNFGFKMVADALAASKDRRWDLSSVKGLVNAGEQVTLPVVQDFLERVAPFGVTRTAMQPAFGMAEACTCMTYDERFDFERSIHRVAKSSLHAALRPAVGDEPATVFVDCGPVVRGVQIRIADKSNAVLREGTIGRLQIKGPVITPGYLNNPAANEESMVGDGWFNTGDLGFMWDGRLTITGREKELIIVNGANFYCYEIEDLASGLPGVLPTFTAACGVADPATGTEALAFFFVHDASSGTSVAEVARRVRTEIAANAGLSPAYVVPVARDEFPKTTSGKIQRGQLKQWLGEGRFKGVLKELDIQLENSNTLPDWFYRPTWRRTQLLAPTALPAPGARVIFADRRGIGAALARTWEGHGLRTRLVDVAANTNTRIVIEEVLAELGPIDLVVHLRTCDAIEGDVLDATDAALDRGVFGVLAVVQALALRQPDHAARFIVGTSGLSRVIEGDSVVPAHAVLSALVKTAPVEHASLDLRVVDLDEDDPRALADALAAECDRGSNDRDVAYRRGERFVRLLEKVDVVNAPPAPPLFRHHGMYLLTGGLGGVGTEVARHLLTSFEARLLIVGRTPLDEAAGAAPAADPRVGPLSELRKLRGEVLYAAADVADVAALGAAVTRAEAHWGAGLDGVVHLAGVFAERQLAAETADSFAATLRPKVQGTIALQRVLDGRPAATMVTFSSAYGLLGGFGAGAYACANAFLDGFSEWQAGHAGRRACNVAWSLWNDTGMGRGYSNEAAARARGFRLMSRRHAVHSLAALEHRGLPHVVVGLDEGGRAIRGVVASREIAAQHLVACCVVRPGVDAGALASSMAIADLLGHATRCAIRRMEALPRTAGGAVDRWALAAGREAPVERVTPRTEIERVVAAVWQEALKQDGLGVHDNFFELGGTSFLAGQIAGRLRARLQTDVVSTQMFQFPTIAAQAAFLTGEDAHSEALATSQSRGTSRREVARKMRRGTPRQSIGD